MNELHERFSDKGLVILGVPCNQFGYQVGMDKNTMSDSFISPGGQVPVAHLTCHALLSVLQLLYLC